MIDIRVGHVLDRLRELPAESVHMCVTSPPYYGLRSYGTEPQVWGDGWRGDLGLEPTLELYLDHMVDVCREVRRVLRRDGTFWLNIGDSYSNHRVGDKGGMPGQTLHSGDERGKPARPNKGNDGADAGRAEGCPRRANRQNGFKEKDLMLIPARLAIRLQEDGWWVRSDIIWAKRSPMPESCADRPTSAHEHVFLLAKSPKYFWDAVAVQEDAESDHPSGNGFKRQPRLTYSDASGPRGSDEQWDQVGGKRNMRNFWLLGPEPFPEAHFATFVSEIPRRAILAGTSAKGVCAACGAPWERVTKQGRPPYRIDPRTHGTMRPDGNGHRMPDKFRTETETVGWRASCSCAAGAPVPATVLDPFLGSGTTALVADRLWRNCIGIELSPEYAAMARRRLRDDAGMFAALAAE